jgi:hypothetical protein
VVTVFVWLVFSKSTAYESACKIPVAGVGSYLHCEFFSRPWVEIKKTGVHMQEMTFLLSFRLKSNSLFCTATHCLGAACEIPCYHVVCTAEDWCCSRADSISSLSFNERDRE